MAILEWLNANSGMLSAAATVALTVFAGIELSRGRKVRERADAEVGAHAYALRRELNNMIGGSTFTTGDALRGHAAGFVAEHLPGAETRALAMVTAAGGASAGQAKAARRAYVLFYQAADQLEEVAKEVPPSGEVRRWDVMEDARDTLSKCVAELGNAIPPELAEVAPGFEGDVGFRSLVDKVWNSSGE